MATTEAPMSGWNAVQLDSLHQRKRNQIEQIAQSKEDLEAAKESPALGFIFNTDEVKSRNANLQIKTIRGCINTLITWIWSKF